MNRKIELDNQGLPHWALALLPIVLVIGTVVGTKNLMTSNAGVVLGLALGIIASSLIGLRSKNSCLLKSLSVGSNNGGNALILAAAVIGFAGVVRSVPVFQTIVNTLLSMDMNPYIKEAVSVNIIAGVVGSATGGVQIFMQVLGQAFLDMGLNPEAIHRVATVASGGLDSLPHCSSVVIMLSAMGLTHKEAYKDFAVVTVLIPIAATVVAVLMATTLY